MLLFSPNVVWRLLVPGFYKKLLQLRQLRLRPIEWLLPQLCKLRNASVLYSVYCKASFFALWSYDVALDTWCSVLQVVWWAVRACYYMCYISRREAAI